MSSYNGINWTLRTQSSNNNWTTICYGNGQFVIVSYGQIDSGGNIVFGGTSNVIMTSPDGINWSDRSAPNDAWINIIYANNSFLVLAQTNSYMISSDLTNWTTGTTFTRKDWRSITYYNGKYVAVASTSGNNNVMTGVENASCYNKGTKILCLIDEKEEYVEIEKLKIGDIVKTYLNGYKKIKLIGSKLTVNNTFKRENSMYDYKGNILTGGHYLLVDCIDEKIKENNTCFYYGQQNMIEDKYLLLVCDSTESVQIINDDTYEVYHFVLDGDKINYGVYIGENILSESTSEFNFYKNNFQ
jgi:hypothetical protein